MNSTVRARRDMDKPKNLSSLDDQRLISRLDAYCDIWKSFERTRRSRDRQGISLFRGVTKFSGFNENRLLFQSNAAVALFERVVSEVLRGMPEPEIEAVNHEREEAAAIAQGAVRTNWRRDLMQRKLSSAYRLSGFTRAVGMYTYWKEEALNGIGDNAHETIQADRLIVDNRYGDVQDMEYVGFEKYYSRSKLITLFPSKVEEIEKAAEQSQSAGTSRGADENPLSYGQIPQTGQTDRLVTTATTQTPPYSPVTSINYKRKRDPLSDQVCVRFMWYDDPTPKKIEVPVTDELTGEHQYAPDLDEDGKLQFDDEGHDVVHTVLGPQYVPRRKPRTKLLMEEKIVRKYPRTRHVAYIPSDQIVLWDVSWDGPTPISIIRDRAPADGFYAEGTALRLHNPQMGRNITWTIIIERLRKSLAGTFLTTPGSGLKRTQLVNEIGKVFTINSLDQFKEINMQNLDSAYMGMVDKIEQEMELLIGVTPAMRGQAAGRADSPATYEQLADQSGGPILDRAKLIDQFIEDQARIDLWFMQNFYTHRHVVEVENEIGFSTWQEASALAMDGEFEVRVKTGSTLVKNSSNDFQEAQKYAQAGFYALPALGKYGKVPHYRDALKQRMKIQALGPAYAGLLGPAAATPAQQQVSLRSQQQRNHHKPGGK
jgi:hypothetical protein